MVSTALFTGLSGLRVHQSYIDVIGNNLANVSTTGFRGSRATFSDILSFTLRTGAGPAGNFGGLNPLQIGHGSVMSTVDIDTNQGTFQDTGRPLDIALQGRGFFTLTDGLQTYYTRVGTFGIDASRQLVDLRTGMHVLNSTGANITVPVTDTLPAQATQTITFQGNLPARVTGPLEEIVQTESALQEGTSAAKQAVAGGATAPQFDLTAFAGRTVLVRVDSGAAQSFTIPTGTGVVNASTVAGFFNGISGVNVVANDAAGTIDFDTIRLGEDARLKFDDGPNASGLLQALGLDATMVTGTETAATATTDLAQMTALDVNQGPYQAGDQITISGTNPDGTPFSDTFVYGNGAGQDGTTLGAFVTFINATIDSPAQATASINNGNLVLTSTNKGPADLSMFIGDASGNNGANDWPSFEVTQAGTGPDQAVTSIEVIDSQGLAHSITMTYTRSAIDSSVWDMVATMDPSEGNIAQDTISQIRFNNDGSFNVIGGGTNQLQFNFNGISATQSVRIDLGTAGQFDGVAMLGDNTTIAATDQDGYGPGQLLNYAFDPEGNLTGYYSNGQSQTLATLRVSVFSNEAGLLRVGDTMFVESPNSNDAIITTAGSAGAGTIRAGSLEQSNVDIAREFVNLIQAQRGFQANSRVITTTDEMLAELMGIVR